MRSGWTVRAATWAEDEQALRAVRTAVFVVEQRVPEALEWDGEDTGAAHVLAIDADGSPIGTARASPDGRLGRMAVLADWRGQGVGAALLRRLLDGAALAGHVEVILSAQVQAIGFYASFGFVVEGPVYDDAGIPHRTMRLTLRSRAHRPGHPA
jgi:predicted GNAT family N-acyltransferase